VKYLILFITSVFISPIFDVAHEFHVSKCLVEYKAENAEVQISMNMFIDDLETALASRGVEQLFIGTEKESQEADEYIEKYIDQVFQIEIDSLGMVDPFFLGKEVSEDLTSIWCYMQIPMSQPIQSLKVKNSILLETFDDQKNITNIIGPKNKRDSFMSIRGDDVKEVSY